MSTSQNTKDLQWFLQATKSETLNLHSISFYLSQPTSACFQETENSININISNEPKDFLWRLPKLVLHEIISLLSDEDFDSLAQTSKRMQAYCESFEIEEKIALLLCLKDKLISFNSQVSLQQFINDQAVNDNVREAQEMARLLIEEYGMTRVLELNGSGLEQASFREAPSRA